jgi:hypothetical protein
MQMVLILVNWTKRGLLSFNVVLLSEGAVLKRLHALMYVCDDVIECVLLKCSPLIIMQMCLVSKTWKRNVDRLSAYAWKSVYQTHVGWTKDVRDDFDWRYASVLADKMTSAVEARCTWSEERVLLVSPWLIAENSSSDALQKAFIIGSVLRSGVERNYEVTTSSQGVCLAFVYDGAFELRGVRETCRRRSNVRPCKHCAQRKGCLDPHYKYYISKLQDNVDEELCLRVRKCLFS